MDLDRIRQHIAHGEQGSVRDFSLALRGMLNSQRPPLAKDVAVDPYGPGGIVAGSVQQVLENLADRSLIVEAIANSILLGSVQAVRETEIPSSTNTILVAGFYVPGDGGGALYVRASSEPAHAGKVESADGAWWELAEQQFYVEMFGAVGDNTNDDAPHFRDGIDFLEKRGGGVLYLSPRTYFFGSTTKINGVADTPDDSLSEITVNIAVPARVSIIGVRGRTKIYAPGGGRNSIISPYDWSDAKLSGFEVEGHGSTGNTVHGIFTNCTDRDHVHENCEISDIYIHHVGSYGIGYQRGLPKNFLLKNVLTTDTGADGVDWKVRGSSIANTFSEGVVFDNIEVRRFGNRITGGTATGLGIRGPVQASNIRVYELSAGRIGIQLTPGMSNALTNQDHRIPASRSTLTNWYVEGKREDYADPAVGLSVFDAEAIEVGPGVARWCVVRAIPGSATPYYSLHGSRIRATIIPPVNSFAMQVQRRSTSVDVSVLSDYDMYSPKANNATIGQTEFVTPAGYEAFVEVARETSNVLTTLTEGVDYTLSGDTITLQTGLSQNEHLYLIYPPAGAVEVNSQGENAVISGRADRWCKQGIVYTDPGLADTCVTTGFVHDSDLRAEISRPLLKDLPTDTTGLPSGTVWSDGGALKVAP